jgi:hypothetical protein
MIQKMILALVMVAIAAVPCAMTFSFLGRRGEERPRGGGRTDVHVVPDGEGA